MQYLENIHRLSINEYQITNEDLQNLGNVDRLDLQGCIKMTDDDLIYLANIRLPTRSQRMPHGISLLDLP